MAATTKTTKTTKTAAAREFVKREFSRGLGVYVFEVADFFGGSYKRAESLMAKMVAEGKAERNEIAESVNGVAAWDRGPRWDW